MKALIKFIKGFFITLGVIFFILIIIGIYLWIKDPWGLKPILTGFNMPINFTDQSADRTKETSDHPLLDAEQEATLEKYGVDPTTLPTTITPELEKCFTEKLGSVRVNEIKAGADPGAFDFIKASPCLK